MKPARLEFAGMRRKTTANFVSEGSCAAITLATRDEHGGKIRLSVLLTYDEAEILERWLAQHRVHQLLRDEVMTPVHVPDPDGTKAAKQAAKADPRSEREREWGVKK